jgi:hypothetical protein
MHDTDIDSTDDQRARILGETARIEWSELARWFANGSAIYVAPELDLVETAYQLSQDNAAQFREWMASRQIAHVSDRQAREWHDTKALLWTVVVKPWVLVQPPADDVAPQD